mmetsp:Transcript_56149/g.134619  ORF Transcript_56149/g.134619 Transcript_56149/m.134619 type:complete len:289 (+) Transcript_56149:77-943(+)
MDAAHGATTALDEPDAARRGRGAAGAGCRELRHVGGRGSQADRAVCGLPAWMGREPTGALARAGAARRGPRRQPAALSVYGARPAWRRAGGRRAAQPTVGHRTAAGRGDGARPRPPPRPPRAAARLLDGRLARTLAGEPALGRWSCGPGAGEPRATPRDAVTPVGGSRVARAAAAARRRALPAATCLRWTLQEAQAAAGRRSRGRARGDVRQILDDHLPDRRLTPPNQSLPDTGLDPQLRAARATCASARQPCGQGQRLHRHGRRGGTPAAGRARSGARLGEHACDRG